MIAQHANHKQVMIKVNAECDEGVAPLVLALNKIEGVITLDSCQKGAFGEANVFFLYGQDWQDLANLLQTISSELSKTHLACGYILRIEWMGSNEWPHAQIVLSPEHVAILARSIRALSGQINARMCQLAGGRVDTELHS